ncbi:ACP S-malonyltransferase [Oscillochloris sp. ZM17-4]|uniref:ACP S-malonyltransferase n=1 Tax=Oscillochloris sp. ZM17-4 TaxID=2866714 RepID=UPI001C7310CC|nr:ACP S-malonyltransferase [Oscillochloris sp. ZM17-4]MBX0330467.1 ACP S-malonyltransferase [Oscillochloris sp. ZM17-4]
MAPKIAVLFPGQGSQYIGMGKALAATFPEAARVFAQADDVLGFALSDRCFHGPDHELNDTANAQPGIFVTSVAAWQVIGPRLGVAPTAVAGHSLGEYSALVSAGALDFADGLRLVRARGLAMRAAGELAPGGMLAVLGLKLAQVAQLCAQVAQETEAVIEVANDNSPGQVVVAGDHRALEVFAERCVQHGAMPPTWLKVSVAPHTSLMRSAIPGFLDELAQTPIVEPSLPIIGNTTAEWLRTPAAIREELSEQLTRTVRWVDSMQRLAEVEVAAVLEVAPGKVLTGLMRMISRTAKRFTFGDNPAELDGLLAALQTV